MVGLTATTRACGGLLSLFLLDFEEEMGNLMEQIER